MITINLIWSIAILRDSLNVSIDQLNLVGLQPKTLDCE